MNRSCIRTADGPRPQQRGGERSAANRDGSRSSGLALQLQVNTWFMGSLHDFDAAHWDHEPLTAWSPGFSRPKPFEPPKGGTPNQPRFMESLHVLATAHWDHEPV